MKEPALGQLLSSTFKGDVFRSKSPVSRKTQGVDESISALLNSTFASPLERSTQNPTLQNKSSKSSKELVHGLKSKDTINASQQSSVEEKVLESIGQFTGLLDRNKAELLLFQRTVGHFFSDLDKLDSEEKGGFEDLTQEFRQVLDSLLSSDTDNTETRGRLKEFILDLLKEVESYITQFKRLSKLLKEETNGFFSRVKDTLAHLEQQIVNELANTIYHNEKLAEKVARLEGDKKLLTEREVVKTKERNSLKTECANMKWQLEELTQKLEIAESRLTFAEGTTCMLTQTH